jgi:hypothetical protein
MMESLEEYLEENKKLVAAFIEGAKWWEFHKSGGFTMWQSDQNLALKEAEKRFMPQPQSSPREPISNQAGSPG